MYSRQEASQLRQRFWTAFGLYMQPILSSEGEKINWINYKTGKKGIHFKLSADAKQASISVELSHVDTDIQQLYFEQFKAVEKFLVAETGENWQWELHTYDDLGKQVSRIYTLLSPVNIYNQEDWPALISFFKPRMIALDAFWNNVKYSFEALR